MRVGVLASGSGSNFQALVDALHREGSPARVTCLICNVPGAKVLERAAKAGVETVTIDHKTFPSREAFDGHLAKELLERGVELIVLAGYMRLVTSALLSRFPGRVVNVHPALLPAFPGLHAPRQALAYGVAISGCTVHFVDEGTDTGPIIAQAAVPVQPDDDEASLTARIQKEEHRLFPAVVREIAKGTISVEGRRVKRPGVIA
ncbi:MAG: phosphoribosylglycinamide formyltransferase [Myxococcales bacterium]|nr:phosphoribosylglycinamide formyltransferase [Myxococcales bacterium]